LDEALATTRQLAGTAVRWTTSSGSRSTSRPGNCANPGLPDTLAGLLIRHDVPTEVVVLEITESVMVDASAVTDQVLFELRRMGVRIVVDDFGTGYSALGY